MFIFCILRDFRAHFWLILKSQFWWFFVASGNFFHHFRAPGATRTSIFCSNMKFKSLQKIQFFIIFWHFAGILTTKWLSSTFTSTFYFTSTSTYTSTSASNYTSNYTSTSTSPPTREGGVWGDPCGSMGLLLSSLCRGWGKKKKKTKKKKLTSAFS